MLLILDAFETDCKLRAFFFGRDIESKEYLSESDLPVAKIARCFESLKRAK